MGMVLPLMLSIATTSNWWNPLLVFGFFLVLEATTANLFEPWLLSSRTGISSLALLSSAIFWSMLWGWPGLALATPLTVCAVVLGQYVPQLSFLHSLLGTNATLSPAARLYERLLAMDQAEAWAVAKSALDGRALLELYDSVILPVLGLAEEDRQKGALSDVRWNFMLLWVGDAVARLSDYEPAGPTEPKSQRSLQIEARRALLRKEFAVVCVFPKGRADELAMAMLTQLLERGRYQTLMVDAEGLSDEVLRALSTEKDTVVFISKLPPFGFAQTRALYQRVRTQLPENRIAVALWNSKEDSEEMLMRFGAAHPDAVVSTLEQSLAQVETWRQDTRKA
jgi:hypothetical protein